MDCILRFACLQALMPGLELCASDVPPVWGKLMQENVFPGFICDNSNWLPEGETFTEDG